MWIYEKSLERPVTISRPDPAFAKLVITQYGGPDGELSASLRYLNQRYSMPTDKAKALYECWHRILQAKLILCEYLYIPAQP